MFGPLALCQFMVRRAGFHAASECPAKDTYISRSCHLIARTCILKSLTSLTLAGIPSCDLHQSSYRISEVQEVPQARMASLRRNKTLSPDGQTARFLYTIIKQLDLKTIDWNSVAEGLDITNGHAARMRFSRFKQHIEGAPTQPRAARAKKEGEKDPKPRKSKGVKRAREGEAKEEDTKLEDDGHEEARLKQEGSVRVKPELDVGIKDEPGVKEERSSIGEPPLVKVKREPSVNGIAYTLSDSSIDTRQHCAVSADTVPRSMPLPDFSPHQSRAQATVAPNATVALADLQLSPEPVPPLSSFGILDPRRESEAKRKSMADAISIKKERDLDELGLCNTGKVMGIKMEPLD